MSIPVTRCPQCHRKQFVGQLFGGSWVEIQCRCKMKLFVTAQEVLVVTNAASVSRTFDGRVYLNGMVTI
jgi:hypothetical protein